MNQACGLVLLEVGLKGQFPRAWQPLMQQPHGSVAECPGAKLANAP